MHWMRDEILTVLTTDIASYAPGHFVRPEIQNLDNVSQLINDHFQYAVQHPTMFQALVTLAHADSSISSWTDPNGDPLTLHLHGQAISSLRVAIANPQQRMEDATIFSVMALLGVNYLLNDLRSFEANIIGLRQLLALRGGADALGWSALVKPNIVALETFWTYLSYQPHLASSQEIVEPSDIAPALVISESIYTQTDRIKDFITLPAGFRVLARSHRLSDETIQIVDQLADIYSSLQWASPSFVDHGGGIRKFTKSKNDTGRETTFATNLLVCERLALQLVRHELNSVDRACCIGLFILSLGSTRGEQLSPIYLVHIQRHARELLRMSFNESDTEAIHLLTWALLVVAATTFPPKHFVLPKEYNADPRYALAKKAVSQFPSSCTWSEMSDILRQFFWNPSCLIQWQHVWKLGTRLY